MDLSDSIQANSDQLSRAYGAIDALEKNREADADRIDRLSRRLNGYAQRREAP